MDTRQGVVQASDRYGSSNPQIALVALSAEAWEAASALGVACRPISSVIRIEDLTAVPRSEVFARWIRALVEFEGFLAEESRDCRFDGPGILMSQIYRVAKAIDSVRYRARLMIAATAAIGPSDVTVIETRLDPWFAGAGYEFNPWTLAFRTWLASRGIPANLVSLIAEPQAAGPSPLPLAQSLYFKSLAWARRKPLLQRLKRAVVGIRHGQMTPGAGEFSGLRVLFSDTVSYDWTPVYRRLHERGARLYLLESNLYDPLATYSPRLSTNRGGTIELFNPEDEPGEDEQSRVAALFDNWRERTPRRAELWFDGIDTLRPLEPYLRALAARGPALLRKTDRIVASALDYAHPQAVCFFAIAYPYQKRMAYACAGRGIPVVSYQHGGAYGTHEFPEHDFMDNADADHFLVYGRGILPPGAPLLPRRAAYVPVGSARLDALQRACTRQPPKAGTGARFHIVWAGEPARRNGVNSGHIIEDTTRYRLETDCLTVLSRNAALRVTYRPFPGELAAQATLSWLRRMEFPNIAVNTNTRMTDLLRQADLLVAISTSGTVWNEALALGLPMVAYANPVYIRMRESFVDELGNACLLCRNDGELKAEMEQLAAEGADFLARFTQKTAATFLRDYVIHDGDCAAMATRFMVELCRSALADPRP